MITRRVEHYIFRQWQKEQRNKRAAELAANKELYKELTEEEKAQRESEAQAAHDAEQRMLSAGIENLARKFHEIDTGRNDIDDVLEQAAIAAYQELQNPLPS